MKIVPEPCVVAIEMGYGHLRPAHALSRELGVPLLEVDRPPLAGAEEQALWARTRRVYEGISRLSQVGGVGRPLRRLLEGITAIPPLHPLRDLTAPTRGTQVLGWLARRGLGQGMVGRLRATGAPLLTTFFAPAVIADAAGLDSHCVVTDSDINRIWASERSRETRVTYYAPSPRVKRRLVAYGVPEARTHVTGFPLPGELLGGPGLDTLRENLAARLVRLDPTGVFRHGHGGELAAQLPMLPRSEERIPPLVTYAVGGAGAQAELVDAFLPSLAPSIRDGRLRLALVAGIRREVAERFERAIAKAGLGADVEILLEPDHDRYFRRFNQLLARTDVLWSKPSEITFFAALGLPMVCSWPVGVHEQYNRRWVIEAGAGLKQRDPRFAGEWLADWLADGTLAGAAWSGFRRLPAGGLYNIVKHVREDTDARVGIRSAP
jgi:hypothetical protein